MTEEHTARIGKEFNEEIEKIKDLRLVSGKDKTRVSTRKLTNLIIKHNYWDIIKKEMVEFEFESKEY